MSAVFRITSTPTFRDLRGRFARAEQTLLTARREEYRALGGRSRDVLAANAPRKTGAFAGGIRYRTFERGDAIGVTLSVPAPLGDFITLGTKAHAIRPVSASVLRFEAGGETVFARGVNHPGTRPNPFIQRSLEQLAPEIDVAVRRISLRWEMALV